MKKVQLSLLALMCTISSVFSQSKVFKEVNNAISSQVSAILQDNLVIGYLTFTRLEAVDEDYYNYKITIMDENLDDIGTVNFKDQNLQLKGISFEKDVLCIAYLKSNLPSKRYRSKKLLEEASVKFKTEVKLQFLSLEGKIIDSSITPVEIERKPSNEGYGYFYARDNLKHSLKLINIPDYGFACFYGDEKKNLLNVYTANGKKAWQKTIKEAPLPYTGLLVSGTDLYLLTEGADNKNIKKHYQPNSYELLCFNVNDSSAYPKIRIRDKKDHQLHIFSFEKDPASGKPYISGFLKSMKKNAHPKSVNGYARGHQAGVFTFYFTSPAKKEVKENFIYWDDASNAQISANGYLEEQQSYPRLAVSFRDFEGNTYFTGDGLVRSFSTARSILSLVNIPLSVLSPKTALTVGTRKGRLGSPVLLKLDNNGKFNSLTMFKGERYWIGYSNYELDYLGNREYFPATNYDSKQQFLIVTERTSTSIYNVTDQKLVRNIPLNNKEVRRAVLPAKEGHILISEYNKKEKSTRISIEAI